LLFRGDYLNLLKTKKANFFPLDGTDKTDKTPSVSFVSCPVEEKNSLFSSGKEAGTRWLWRIEFPDRPAKIVSYTPPSTRAEVMADYPAAIRTEPLTPPMTSPGAPMICDEEMAIRAWLDRIGEHDPTTRAEVLGACRADYRARDYFVRRAVAL
jgi:hypothetical protein